MRHVDQAHVERLHAPMGAVVNCLMQWGIGAKDVFTEHETGDSRTP